MPYLELPVRRRSARRPPKLSRSRRRTMTADPFGLLFFIVLMGGVLILGLLGVRTADQEQRDAQRAVVTVRFPRKVTAEQTLAVVRLMIGTIQVNPGLMSRS